MSIGLWLTQYAAWGGGGYRSGPHPEPKVFFFKLLQFSYFGVKHSDPVGLVLPRRPASGFQVRQNKTWIRIKTKSGFRFQFFIRTWKTLSILLSSGPGTRTDLLMSCLKLVVKNLTLAHKSSLTTILLYVLKL